jgi:hypothetical protein
MDADWTSLGNYSVFGAKSTTGQAEETARMIERERLRFVRREIEAAELVTAKALEILRQPYDNCTPTDAARLFAVGHQIGASALGLPGSNLGVGVSGIAPPANIQIHLTRDETGDRVQRIQYEFLKKHMEHPQAARFIAQYEAEYGQSNGENGDGDSE